MTFRETPVFTKQYHNEFETVETLVALQNDLLKNPERGDLIQGTGGARKGRIAAPGSGRGKSGSYRYIYVYFEKAEIIYLIFFYAKGVQVNLTGEQKKRVAGLISEARKSLGGE